MSDAEAASPPCAVPARAQAEAPEHASTVQAFVVACHLRNPPLDSATLALLWNLLEDGAAEVRVLFVDDASTNGADRRLADVFGADPRVHLLRLGRYHGFVRSARAAFAEAERTWPKMRYFCMLDQFCRPMPGWRQHVVRAFKAEPDAVMVGTLVESERGMAWTRQRVLLASKSPLARFRQALDLHYADEFRYAVMRASLLRWLGGYPAVAQAPFLLVFLAALKGKVQQVPHLLIAVPECIDQMPAHATAMRSPAGFRFNRGRGSIPWRWSHAWWILRQGLRERSVSRRLMPLRLALLYLNRAALWPYDEAEKADRQ